MKQINYTITLNSPVLISSNSGDRNTVETMDYIPGVSVSGLIAHRYLQEREDGADDEFYSLFFRNNAVFTNAYRVHNNRKSYPAPLSLQSDKADDEKIYDLIFYDKESEMQTVPLAGFCIIKDEVTEKPDITKTLHFHHERDRETGTTKERIIFNYESLDAGQVFQGSIIGHENYLETVKRLLEKNKTAYLGRSKTAQYGKVTFELKGISDFEPEIDDLDRDDSEGIVMTLLSDAIVCNENGLSEVSIPVMEKELGVNVKKAFLKKDTFENFVSVWKVKKPMENVFKMGSCFLLEKLPSRYEELELLGIGERTSEGFGRVVFGWQQNEEYSKVERKKDELQKPPIPELSKKILTAILEDKLKSELIIQAFDDAGKFKNKLISNSLIGRLSSFTVKGIEKFEENLSSLKGTPKRELEKCDNGKENLKEFLEKISLYADEKIKSIQNNNSELVAETGYSDNEETKRELKKTYLQNFFNQLRRENKKRKKNE